MPTKYLIALLIGALVLVCASVGIARFSFGINLLAAVSGTAPVLGAQVISNSQITLSWTDTTSNESGFNIERSLSGSSNFSLLKSVGSGTTSYTDTSLAASTTYYYRVRAYQRKSGRYTYTAYSNIANATTLGAPGGGNGCANASTTLMAKDLWTWDDAVATDATKKSAFFSFADTHAVHTIYLESEALIGTNRAALGSFISEASTHCMGVELLFGNPDWARSTNHTYAVSLAQSAVTFANGLSTTKPKGVHYDVEPYALPEWSTSTTTKNSISNQYLDLMGKIASTTRGTNLTFTEDIPFWFDDHTVLRNGKTLVLSNAVIDIVDRITIMDYRDTAAPIIDLASNEMSYAKTTNKGVVIGTETTCDSSQPSYITFCEEGQAALEQVLKQVNPTESSNSAFRGFAVHHYSAYKILKP